MRKLLFSLLFLFGVTSFAFDPSQVIIKAHDKQDTEYIHAYQDMYIDIDANTPQLTVNIGNLITITSDQFHNWGFLNGSNQVLTANIIYDRGYYYSLKFVVRDDRNFQQDVAYVITVDIGDGSPVVKVLTFNKEYVVSSLTINANSKYRELVFNGSDYDDFFKAGLNNNSFSDANLSITGMVHYRYAPDVFPSLNIPLSIELYISNDIKSVANIGSNGVFTFSNFSIPTASSQINIQNVMVSVDIDGATLYSDNFNKSFFKIAIDNTFPVLSDAALNYIAASSWTSEGTEITPVSGYFNRTTVSFILQEGAPAIYDNDGGSGIAGSGISGNLWVVDPVNSATGIFTPRATEFIVTFTYNDVALQGSKELFVYVFDNVFNYVTMSVKVTIDVTAPNEFVVTIQPDIFNETNQLSPELGWYNDQTVSFNWGEPVDATGILSYQFKSDGWSTWSAIQALDVALGVSQTVKEAWVTVNQGGDIASQIWVRAIDKAGNIKTAYTTVKVDITQPTINLQLAPDLTGKENVLVSILPLTGWYNDLNVKWFCGAEDNGQLRDKAYQYRYANGSINNLTSNLVKIVSEIIVTPDSAVTNNVFILSVVDKAGNVGIVTAQVFVDLLDPDPTNFRISFDACSIKSEGVTPETKWYNQTTVNLSITWDSVIENGELHRVMLYVGQTAVPTIQLLTVGGESISFNNVRVIANDATPINFKALLVDKAGNFNELNDFIYSDVVTPSNFQVVLAYDEDSNNDGLDPELGYYDNPEITFMLLFSQADATARNQPFQFRVNSGSWGEPTSNVYITNFSVSANTSNFVETRYIDKAGNVLTSSFTITVDTSPPAGAFTLILITCNYIPLLQVTPDSGWYNKNTVSFNFRVPVGTEISDTYDIRENGYFLKGETDAYFINGQSNSRNATIYIANGGALQRTIIGAIADMAGNILSSSANVFVDTDQPATDFDVRILDDSDPGIDGIWPQTGWHANPYININWDQANDGAGSLQNSPYRVRSDGTPTWSAFQYQLSYANLYVSPNDFETKNVYIQVRDKAGNLATKSVALKVDITNPEVSLFVSPQIPLSGVTYSFFEQSYNRTFPINGWLNTENVLLTWSVLEDGGFPSKSFRVKFAQKDYGVSLDSGIRNTQLMVSANNHATIDMSILVWDNAGNSKEATTGIKVDTTPPVVSLTMRSVGVSAVMPFVSSRDILYITLNISEPIITTPFVRYTVTGGAQTVITINSFWGDGLTWSYVLNMSSVTYDGIHVFSVLALDDAGNIATQINGYNYFIKLAPQQVPLPVSFSAQDIQTGRKDLTNSDTVSISFIVGTSINKYLVLEGPSANEVVMANSKPEQAWGNLASYNFEDVSNPAGRRYLLQHDFSNEPNLSKNGVRTLHLWVKDGEQMTQQSVTCDIIFDQSKPEVRIRPWKEGLGSEGDYNGFKLAKTRYTAQLEITHNIPFIGNSYNYFERASVTPEWKIVIYSADNSVIPVTTSILSPFTPSAENKAIWWAEYDLYELLGGAPSTYNAFFEITVTDEAKNVTTSVAMGSQFIVDTTIPLSPVFEVYSWDGNSRYTNSLTINYVLSKNVTSDKYFYYYIYDNYYGQPRRTDFLSKSWPGDGYGGKQVSFNSQYLIQDTSQGQKVIRAWVADDYYASCLSPKEWLITYDSIAPTCEVFIQPADQYVGNSLTITMFFNELLDIVSNNNKIWIADKVGSVYSIVQTANLRSLGQIDDKFIYVATIDLISRADAMNKYISINVRDLAGNNLQDMLPFSRPLLVLQYEDYFVRARRNNMSQYSSNALEIGKKDIPVVVAELKASSRDVHLSGVNLMLKNIIESQIERFYIYLDQDKNGLFDQDTDIVLGSNPYQGNSVTTMNIPFNEQIVNYQTTTTIFLVVDIYSGADTGPSGLSNYIGFGFVTNDPFNVAYYESAIPPTSQPADGIVATFNITNTKLNVSYISRDAAANITSNFHAGTSFAVKKFALRSWLADTAGTGGVGGDGALWTALNLKLVGDEVNLIQPTKITRLAIYKDNGNQIFDNADLLISSGEDRFWTAQQTTINIIFPYPVSIGGNDPEFYIVADTDRSLLNNIQFAFEIVSADSFVFRGVDTMIDSGEFPIKTITFNSDYYVSNISVDKFKNTERYVYQDEELNMLKFKLSVDYKSDPALPKLYSIDIYREDGDIRLNDDVDIALYKYAGSQLENDFSYTEEILASVLNGIPAGERVRITLAAGSTVETNQQILVTENYFALVVKPRIAINEGKEGVFKIKFVKTETASGNISFQAPNEESYGTIVNEQDVTTNRIQILNRYQPTKPIITGNAYTDSYRNIRFFYSTTVNVDNNGIDSLFIRVGSTLEGNDIYDGFISVNNVENIKNIQQATINIQITNSVKFLNDNTTYNVSLRTRATQTGTEFLSITGNFAFHTDFTPPWVGNDNTLHVIAKWDENRHEIVWSPFAEAESQIDYYIVEMISGPSLLWASVATNDRYIRNWTNPSVNYDTPYQYRVKAVNAAGLHSLYLDSGDRIMTTNTTEIIFNVSNYPNPFYSSFQTTRIVFSLNQDIDANITIYDSLGHFVRKYDSKDITKESGTSGSGYFCHVDWDGRNASGQFVSKGGYFAVIEAAPYASGGAPTKVVRMIGVIH